MSRRILIGAIVIPLLLVACGGDDGDGVASLGGGSGDRAGGATPSADPEEALVEWAECMREHGVDVPDPQIDEDGGIEIGIGAPPGGGGAVRDAVGPEEFEEANRECQDLLPEGGPGGVIDPEEEAEMRDRILEWAQCMREHGIEVPDPTFEDGPGGGSLVRVGGDGMDPNDPEFQAAEEACGTPGEMEEGS
jgi:hypothetical protein